MRLGRPLVLSTIGGLPAMGLGLALIAGILLAAEISAIIVLRDRQSQPVTIASVSAEGVTDSTAPPLGLGADLLPTTVRQGGAFAIVLRSPNIVAARARFNGVDYPLLYTGGQWLAIAGVGQAVGSIDILPVGSYPVDVTYQEQDKNTTSTARLTLTVTATDFPLDAITLAAGEVGLLDPQLEAAESEQLSVAYGAFTPQQLWQGAFTPPVSGPITTAFGARRAYDGGPVTDSHAGIDIAVPLGTPVKASAAGRVAWVGQLADRGNGVIIDHGLGVYTGYFHLSEILSQPGQVVNHGDVVGLAGSTGLSTGPHVHWEVVVAKTNVDGLLFAQDALP